MSLIDIMDESKYWEQIDVPRNVWDPTEGHHSRHGERPFYMIQGVEVHWAGVGSFADLGDTGTELLSFERFHEVSKGWYDLFYQVGIDSEGYTYEGRDATIPSQSNLTSWLTCLFVLADGDPPPPMEMYVRLYELWGAVDPSRRPGTLRYHGERSSTSCPGPDIAIAVKLMREGWVPPGAGGNPPMTSYEDLPLKPHSPALDPELAAVNRSISDGSNPDNLAARWEAILMADRSYRLARSESQSYTNSQVAQLAASDEALAASVAELQAAVTALHEQVENIETGDVDMDEIVAQATLKTLRAIDGTAVVIEERHDAILDLG